MDALNQTLAVSKSGCVLNQQAISPFLGSNSTIGEGVGGGRGEGATRDNAEEHEEAQRKIRL